MATTKGTERVNEEGAVERKVETVDYRSSPGEAQEPGVARVTLTHEPHHSRGGVLAGAAAAISKTFQSAKNTITGKGKSHGTPESSPK
ncbi:hypothetical protein RJ641_032146 [Dillenia turbinata]|uniref:Uncharacterized protein n=1 Tax=Dillenia turbinata TaxID=194707 RepID=A0AAN8W2B2_9MAGN